MLPPSLTHTPRNCIHEHTRFDPRLHPERTRAHEALASSTHQTPPTLLLLHSPRPRAAPRLPEGPAAKMQARSAAGQARAGQPRRGLWRAGARRAPGAMRVSVAGEFVLSHFLFLRPSRRRHRGARARVPFFAPPPRSIRRASRPTSYTAASGRRRLRGKERKRNQSIPTPARKLRRRRQSARARLLALRPPSLLSPSPKNPNNPSTTPQPKLQPPTPTLRPRTASRTSSSSARAPRATRRPSTPPAPTSAPSSSRACRTAAAASSWARPRSRTSRAFPRG